MLEQPSMSFSSRIALRPLLAAAVILPLGLSGCGDKDGYKGKAKSPARKWIDSPSSGSTDDKFIKIPSLGVTFEIPETRYVFKNCAEPSHSPEGPNDWIPLIRCATEDYGGGGDDDWEEGGSESESEGIAMTFYIAPKDRPIDERAVAYFRTQYQQAGLTVNELSFNDDYHNKRGIYAELQVLDEESGNPVREIVQFTFPYKDVILIARMEYPFGDTRSVSTDWSAIMWYFNFEMPAG